MFGVFGGLLILFAGLWLLADGNTIEIRDGSNLTGSITGTFADAHDINGSVTNITSTDSSYSETGNLSGNFIAELNGRDAYTYSNIITPLPIFNDAFGIITILIGISIIYFYAMRYYGSGQT
jgi:hypothetical protein